MGDVDYLLERIAVEELLMMDPSHRALREIHSVLTHDIIVAESHNKKTISIKRIREIIWYRICSVLYKAEFEEEEERFRKERESKRRIK